MHAGVADDHHLVDPLGEHAGLAGDLLDMLVEQADDAGLQLAEVARVELGEGDARHQVAAEHCLGVEARDRRELLARLELHQGGDHAGGADVDGEAELVERGVVGLDREDVPAEGGHGDEAVAIAERRGQALEQRGGDVLHRAARGGHQGLDVGGLLVLVLGQDDRHRALADARVDRDRLGRARGALPAQDLEGGVVERGGDLDGHRLGHRPLAREPVALAHQRVAQLQLVHDGRRGRGARDQLDPARGASTAPAAGGGDVDPRGVGRFQDRRAGLRVEDVAAGQDGQRNRHSGRRIPLLS